MLTIEEKEAIYRSYLKEHSGLESSTTAVLLTKHKLADILITQRECAEAEVLLRDVHPSIRDQYGKHSSASISCYRDLIRAVECQNRHAEVEQMIKEAKTLISGMERSRFRKHHQRIETQWLSQIESDMKALRADVDDRFEAMKRMSVPGYRR